MPSRSSVKTPNNQQGLALLVLIIVIILAFISYALSGLSIQEVKIEQQEKIRTELKVAKEALLSYAVIYGDIDVDAGGSPDFPGENGFLPCPDYNNGLTEGLEDNGNCGGRSISKIGLFPWRTLKTTIANAGSGSCLLYAVTGEYKNDESVFNNKSEMLNEDTSGMFQVVDAGNNIIVGNSPEDRVVAIIFSPGPPLGGQARTFDPSSTCGKDYGNIAAYLDSNGVTDNATLLAAADSIDQFVHGTNTSDSGANPYNDQFITVTRNEIWEPILNREDFTEKMENLTQALAMCAAAYANHADNTSRRLPWPAVTNLGGDDYRYNTNYQDDNNASNGYSGRFPFDITNSNNALGMPVDIDNNLFDIEIDPLLIPPTTRCMNLDLSGTVAGPVIDLDTSTSEYRKIWNNWKDHFFYILSKGYEPSDTGTATCATSGACVTINVNEYAGAVLFSGKRLLDADENDTLRSDKSIVADYLEDGKAVVFGAEATNKTGAENYIYTDPQTDDVNDIMYCIQDQAAGIPLDVVECL
jgi:hypothetical protein